MMKTINREQLNAGALFVMLICIYSYVFPRWADPNQNSRLDMIVAIVDDGTFQIDHYVANTVDYAKVGDHYYSDKAPGTAFLGVPVYAGLKLLFDLPVMRRLTDRLANSPAFQSTLRENGSGVSTDKVRFALAQVALAFVAAALPSAALGTLIYLFLALFASDVRLRLLVALSYGLLTPAYAYADAVYGHQLAAALLFAAFYLVATGRLSPGWLVVIGVLLAFSVITEYPAVLIVAILCAYLAYQLWSARRMSAILWMLGTAAIFAAGWMAYNKYVFGGWLSLGYSASELWQTQHQTGFMSLTMPTLEAAWGITFGVFRGLFILSPILIVALAGFLFWWRESRYRFEWAVCLASTLAFYLFNSSSVMWWGGFSVGPRYILPALPFMALALFFPFKAAAGRTGWWLLFGLLALWSLVATWGLSLANQAFPPDTLANPFWQYALPSWAAGNVARNMGTLLGLHGVWSLMPLVVLTGGFGALWWLTEQRVGGDQNKLA